MQYILKICSCLLLISIGFINVMAQKNTNKEKEKWIQLFNGDDLEDWDIKIDGYNINENFGNTFDVEDGVLKIAQNKKSEDKIIGHTCFINTLFPTTKYGLNIGSPETNWKENPNGTRNMVVS